MRFQHQEPPEPRRPGGDHTDHHSVTDHRVTDHRVTDHRVVIDLVETVDIDADVLADAMTSIAPQPASPLLPAAEEDYEYQPFRRDDGARPQRVIEAGRSDPLTWLESLFRSRQSWLVVTSLTFALSPLAVWAITRVGNNPDALPATTEPASRPIDATEPSVVGGAPTTEPNCHSSYTGCVPLAVDVDCSDSEGVNAERGDGPVFIDGPLLVTGNDPYGLDANGDLVACFNGDY